MCLLPCCAPAATPCCRLRLLQLSRMGAVARSSSQATGGWQGQLAASCGVWARHCSHISGSSWAWPQRESFCHVWVVVVADWCLSVCRSAVAAIQTSYQRVCLFNSNLMPPAPSPCTNSSGHGHGAATSGRWPAASSAERRSSGSSSLHTAGKQQPQPQRPAVG